MKKNFLVFGLVFLLMISSVLALPLSYQLVKDGTKGAPANAIDDCKRAFIDQPATLIFDDSKSSCVNNYKQRGDTVIYYRASNYKDAIKSDLSQAVAYSLELGYCGTGYVSEIKAGSCGSVSSVTETVKTSTGSFWNWLTELF